MRASSALTRHVKLNYASTRARARGGIGGEPGQARSHGSSTAGRMHPLYILYFATTREKEYKQRLSLGSEHSSTSAQPTLARLFRLIYPSGSCAEAVYMYIIPRFAFSSLPTSPPLPPKTQHLLLTEREREKKRNLYIYILPALEHNHFRPHPPFFPIFFSLSHCREAKKALHARGSHGVSGVKWTEASIVCVCVCASLFSAQKRNPRTRSLFLFPGISYVCIAIFHPTRTFPIRLALPMTINQMIRTTVTCVCVCV